MKRVLDPENTFIWYDGLCVPKEKREDGFRSIPFIQRCDFMIIFAPGCDVVISTKFDPLNRKKDESVISNVSS